MDPQSFEVFIGSIAPWAKIESEDFQPERERQLKVAKNFLSQLFKEFDTHHNQNLSLQVTITKKKRFIFINMLFIGCHYWYWIYL